MIKMQQKKYLCFMAMLYVTLLIITALMMYRLVSVRPFIESAGVFVFPLTYAIEDIIAEIYGYAQTRKIIWSALFCLVLSALLIKVILLTPTPESVNNHEYEYILGPLIRISLVAIAAILVGDFINAYLITKWKVLLQGKHFIIRSIWSTACAEIIQSIIAYCGDFVGKTPLHVIVTLVISAYVIKRVYAFVLAFPAAFVVTMLKKIESDVYDYNTNFNPFKLTS